MSMKFRTYRDFLNEALDPSKFLTQEQIDWCNMCIEQKWGVNAKGEVTVVKNLTVHDRKARGQGVDIERFPVKFAPVKGHFICAGIDTLISLEGSPSRVEGGFDCSLCENLPSLVGGPLWVGGEFDCGYTKKLVSLEGAPEHVGGSFSCRLSRSLETLEGAPAFVGGSRIATGIRGVPSFDIEHCDNLPPALVGIIRDYNEKKMDWKMAHKLIHSDTARKARTIGLI
jgi:hypothetical protein